MEFQKINSTRNPLGSVSGRGFLDVAGERVTVELFNFTTKKSQKKLCISKNKDKKIPEKSQSRIKTVR